MLIIFDFDGTLADTWDLVAEELAANAHRLRVKQLDRARIEALRRQPTQEVFRALGVRWWQLPRVVAQLRRRAGELAGRVKLFPGMEDVVIELAKAGHVLAVVSSNAEPTVREVLGPALCARFALFSCSSSVFGKASKFRALRRRAGVATASVVAVGDETRDLDAAKAAGITGMAVEWGYNDPALLRDLAPERTAASPGDLLSMLLRFSPEGN